MKTEFAPISKIKELLAKGYEVEVDSPDGFVPVSLFVDKGMWDEYVLVLSDGSPVVRVNENHLFETTKGWQSAKTLDILSIPQHYLTRNGWVEGVVRKTDRKIPIVDINVESDNHRYYTEEVSSHNTNVGKSLCMCHMAASHLRAGKNVLYITMEMSQEKIAERIDANILDVSMDDLPDLPKDSYDKKMARFKATTNGKLIIKEYPTASAHAGHFRHLLHELRLKKNFVPDIIYIDYLNICSSSRIRNNGSVNSYTLIKSIAEELRGLAVEFNVPIVSATQTNRNGFDSSDVSLTDTSESFGLPATADFMFAVISTEELEDLGQYLIKQLKNRYNGKKAHRRFTIGVDYDKMRLYNVEQIAQEDLLDESGSRRKSNMTKKDDDKPINQFGERERQSAGPGRHRRPATDFVM